MMPKYLIDKDFLYKVIKSKEHNIQFAGLDFPTLQHSTIVFTMLLGHVSFPGLWRVVMHSQYLSMNGMISCNK